MSNMIVLSLVTVTIVAFCFKSVREYGIGRCIKEGFKDYLPCGAVHACCALMLGGFYAARLSMPLLNGRSPATPDF